MHQPFVDDDVGGVKKLLSPQGEEPGVARAGPHDGDPPGLGRHRWSSRVFPYRPTATSRRRKARVQEGAEPGLGLLVRSQFVMTPMSSPRRTTRGSEANSSSSALLIASR